MQIQTVGRAEADKVFIVAKENNVQQLIPGTVVEWVQTTTDADQGYTVIVISGGAVDTVAGNDGAKVAGVVNTTINTAGVGRLQIRGPANVRSSASYDTGNLMVATSAGVAPTSVVTTLTASSDSSLNVIEALVGWSLEAGPNATNSTVQLAII